MYIFYLLLILIAAWNFSTSNMYAQNPEWAIYPDMQAITDLAQEGEFLWVTSYGGVAKLNRHTLESTLFTKANAGLPDHNVLTVNVQANSKKWFRSTYQGLMLLDNNQWSIFMRDTYPIINAAKPVVQEENIWLRGGTDTLIRYDGQNWQNIDVSDVTENADNITDIYWDGSSLWAGSTCTVKDSFCTALYRLIDGEWSSILLPSDKEILSISPVAHRKNTMWYIGMEKQTDTKNRRIVFQYDGTTWSSFALEDMGITSRYAYKSMMIDSSGGVWILTTKESLQSMITRYDGSTWRTLDLAGTPLDSLYVTCLFTDSDGVVWAGTGTQGLFQYKNNTWSKVRLGEIEFLPGIYTFNDFRLSSIVIDTDQSIWLSYGTNKETYISGNVWHSDTLPTMQQAPSYFMASVVDPRGTQWLASHEGLWRRQPTSWEKISDEVFTSLYADRSNNIWLGMELLGGVARYNNDEWTYYTGENSSFNSSCIAMTEGKDGTLWAATIDRLLTFDGNVWTVVDTDYPQEISGEQASEKVDLMIADSAGVLWLANKYTPQVFSFDGITWTKYTISDSIGAIPAQEISSLVTDRNGNVWMGTSMNESPNTSLIRVDSHTKEWEVFTPENSPLPYGFISCLAVDTSNTLWIGMNDYNKLISYRKGGISTHVGEQHNISVQPADLRSFPNPTTSHTTLRYSVPPSAGIVPVRIQLFNSLGLPIATLEDARKNSGEYTLDVDVATLATGTYYYRLQIGSSIQTQQLVVVK